jgi:hypothetical protein
MPKPNRQGATERDQVVVALGALVREPAPLDPVVIMKRPELLDAPAVLARVGQRSSDHHRAVAVAEIVRETIPKLLRIRHGDLVAGAMFGIDDVYDNKSVEERRDHLETRHRLSKRQYYDRREPILTTIAAALQTPSEQYFPSEGLTAYQEEEAVADVSAFLDALGRFHTVALITALLTADGLLAPRRSVLAGTNPLHAAWCRYYTRSVAYADWCFTDRYPHNGVAAVSRLFADADWHRLHLMYESFLVGGPLRETAARNAAHLVTFPRSETRPGRRERDYSAYVRRYWSQYSRREYEDAYEMAFAVDTSRALLGVSWTARPSRPLPEPADEAFFVPSLAIDLIGHCYGAGLLSHNVVSTDFQTPSTLRRRAIELANKIASLEWPRYRGRPKLSPDLVLAAQQQSLRTKQRNPADDKYD